MTTMQIRNTVRDFEEWKEAFDKFERFRADHGVRSYRILRHTGNEDVVEVALDFESVDAARDFRRQLEKIWETPQSRSQLISHEEPILLEVVVDRTL
jgi:hypothetical protein